MTDAAEALPDRAAPVTLREKHGFAYTGAEEEGELVMRREPA